MKRKRETSGKRARILFAAAWIASWFIISEVFWWIAGVFGHPGAAPPIIDYLMWLLLLLTFAVVQLVLMRRLLGVEPHRWLLWTLLGLVIGILCDSLVKDLFIQNNWLDQDIVSIYRRARYVMVFGIPTICQYFSLPMHYSRRWYWLLAALPGAMLPGESLMISSAVLVSVVLQLLAILRIAAWNASIQLVAGEEPDSEPVKEKR